MDSSWINQEKIKEQLALFFDDNRDDVNIFGRTVNQTFEAFVFAAVAAWYREKGWSVEFRHPSRQVKGERDAKSQLRLKFSTRGRPANYSYVVCKRGDREVHVRHQLRVATCHHRKTLKRPANVCLDVAVIQPIDLSHFMSDHFVPNEDLITFGEAKHMSAFAELLANFVGLVHEMQPGRLKRIRTKSWSIGPDLSPFLYVSGFLFKTAQGIQETIERRRFDVDVFSRTKELTEVAKLPSKAKKQIKKAGVHVPAEELPF